MDNENKEPPVVESKNAARKRRRYEHVLEHRKQAKIRKKEEKKANKLTKDKTKVVGRDDGPISKQCDKLSVNKLLEEGMISGQRICIDCSMEDTMSDKECGKFAQQFCRLYGCNRQLSTPASIYLAGLKPGGRLDQQCVKKCCGFNSYKIHRRSDQLCEVFPNAKEIVYLTPDSPNILDDVTPDCVYVIGGLVDENINKNLTLNAAKAKCLQTARLPIEKFMIHAPLSGQRNPSQVLAMNQVFYILTSFLACKNWSQALAAGVPPRFGYINSKISTADNEDINCSLDEKATMFSIS